MFNRVKQNTTTVGLNHYALATTAAPGFITLQAAYDVGFPTGQDVSVPYVVTNDTDWEVGFSAYIGNNTLERTQVVASSNAGALVDWPAGDKTVFVSAHAQVGPFGGKWVVSDTPPVTGGTWAIYAGYGVGAAVLVKDAADEADNGLYVCVATSINGGHAVWHKMLGGESANIVDRTLELSLVRGAGRTSPGLAIAGDMAGGTLWAKSRGGVSHFATYTESGVASPMDIACEAGGGVLTGTVVAVADVNTAAGVVGGMWKVEVAFLTDPADGAASIIVGTPVITEIYLSASLAGLVPTFAAYASGGEHGVRISQTGVPSGRLAWSVTLDVNEVTNADI